MINKTDLSNAEFKGKVLQLLSSLENDVSDLKTSFQQLEAGRLSHLETQLAEMQGKMIAMTGGIAFVVSTGVVILGFFLKK